MAQASGQKHKHHERTESQTQPPMALTSLDVISLYSESESAEEESYGDEEPQHERTESQTQPPMALTSLDVISLYSESESAEEESYGDEEPQIRRIERVKLQKSAPQPEGQEMAQASGQKPKQPERTETQIQQSPTSINILDMFLNKSALDGFTNKNRISDKKWIEENIKLRNPTDEVASKPCDAFGKIKFTGHNQENAMFVRVDHKTQMEIMMCLIKSTWSCNLPGLLISVIGGRDDIQLNKSTKEAVRHGLYKAARTIDTWIITEGLHTGVAKYIGEVIHGKESKAVATNGVTTLGIAPWNCVRKKKPLVNKEGSWPAEYSVPVGSNKGKYALDPNHSHFILVDDGTKDTFEEIIKFRKELEYSISQEKIPKQENVKIPAVVVMVGGGHETLKSVLDSISYKIPVVIVKGCGRAADFMAFANQTKFEYVDEDDGKLKADIREKITKEFGKECEKNVIDNMVDYVLESLKRPNLISVYDTDSAEDFDIAIFKAVFKAQNNKLENMRLSFVWDRSFIVKSLIFEEEIQRKEDDIDTSEKERSVTKKKINSCDEFGEVKFEKGNPKIAKIDYRNHHTPMEIIIHLLMHRWCISSLPSLLISVIGGKEDFQLNQFTKEALGRGLVKATRDKDVWIISEDLHTGVEKCVEEAITDKTSKSNCHSIGIVPQNCVKDMKTRRWQNYRRDDSNTRMFDLNLDHSQFIFVDESTPDEFRRKFENAIAEMNIPETEVKIPAVAVMIRGGPETLKSVLDSISRNIPVVIVKDSGRAADIMADAYQTKLENANEEDDRKLKGDIREKIIKEFEKELKGNVIDNMVDYVLESLKHSNLLTVYDTDSVEKFDLTMFKAVFKAKNNNENMRLGLAWNKTDVVKRVIFKDEAHLEDVKKWVQENIKFRNTGDEEALNPCDAFGEVKFVEHDQKIAKFVRVDNQTPPEIIIHLIIYQWNCSLPNLLISVIGEREDVQLNEPTKEALGHSLVKAARETDAWIITEGLHTGVAKHIGEAIHDNESKVAAMNEVKTIGIAPWNRVQNKESLVNKEGSWPANYSNGGKYALDPNHTHFILVDDGTKDTFGVEIEFKKQLEDTTLQNIRRGATIPAVAVMVGGELQTLKSVYDSLSRNIPAIIVKGSGQAADIMAYAYETLLKNDEEAKEITDGSILRQLRADIKDKWGENGKHDLVDCVCDSMKHLDLITVCDIQSPEDFDIAIMKAVFKGRKELKEVPLSSERKKIDSLLNSIFSDGTQWQRGRRVKNNESPDMFWRRIDIKKWMQENIKLRNVGDAEMPYPCNAFGEVKFVEDGWNTAKFVRVNHKISMETTIHLIKRLWYSSLPNLLISVIGRREDFQLDPFAREALGRGLVKAAKITGAWIISDGLHTGVAKHIGKAIHDNEGAIIGKKVVTIGIAPWNCVQNKESLVNEEGSWPAEYEIKHDNNPTPSALDPNHSHFILVDNGTQETSGVETEFRKNLENAILQKKIPKNKAIMIPAVAVMVEGGPGILKSVIDSISRNIPVVVVKGSGGVADVVANIYSILFESIGDKQRNSDIRIEKLRDDMRNEIVHKFKKNLKIDEINELFNDVIKSLKQLNLLTVYDIQSTEHFDVAIKKAVFKAKNKSKYLQLLLKWRRIYRVLTTMPPDGTHWQDFQMEVYSKHRAFSDDDDADFSMSRPMEDEMDNSDEESEFEFNEFFKQLRREDKMDSSEEKRPDDKSWLETKPEIDTAFAKIFADIISSGHSGYKYGYKNFVKYSIEEESNTNSLKFQRTISYCVPSFPLKASILDDVQECIQEDLKLRNARGEEPSKPSDALGTVKFVGCEKTAKFVRVDHKTPMGMMMHLIALLWNLALPDLLISVTGERKDLQLTPGIEIFLHRLVKAAETTGAWIISTGLHTGVEKHIGKTIHDDVKNKIVTIGIAPWNCVQNKESLVNKGSWPAKYKIKHDSDSTASALDPNHSHFILVDDGTQETSGVETEFRRMFENTITDLNIPRNEYKVSAVVVMIGGELETLKSVYDSLSCNIPVVIVKGTGQAADIMAYAYERGIENLNKINKFTDLRSLQKKLNDDIRKKITQEFEGLEKKEEDNMVDCVVSSLRRPNLLTVFDINSAEDFGVAIFKALFKTKNKCRNLKLTLKWQRIDNALNKLFTDWTSWQIGKLDKFMISVLEEDMTNIVKLFQEYEINLKEWLTEPHIKTVYQLKNTNLTVDSTCEEFLQSKFLSEIHQEQANLSFATKLFLWALFFNRKEMAFLFWKEGMGALPSALIANNLVKSLQEKCKDYGTSMQLQEQAEFYENHAIGILDECLHADEKQTLDLLLLQQKTWDNSSYMQIAFNVNNENFMAHDACQSLLTKIWMGKINKTNNIWKLLLCTLCPLFLFLIKFDDKKQNLDKEPKKTCSKLWLMFRKCMLFYSTPVIKFWISLIFHIIFLGIYSYVLLVELKPQIFYLEWLLIVWVIGILTEEIHQILVKDLMLTKRSLSLWSKFRKYIHNSWNLIDVITIVLFIIGYILRFLDLEETARVIFCLNLIFFYIRFLHMFSIDKNLGPKLVMIKEMMRDLGYFAMILFIFMTAFGIATQSILNPSTPASFELIKEVFRKAYFHIYAEIFIEEYEGNPNCKANNSTCPTEISTYSATILMCVYVLLTNILLLNLLIAMFSSTYEKVQKKSHLHWSFQRYDIINEFSIRPPLPPPFVLLSNIYQFCRYLYKKAKDQELKIKYVFSCKYDNKEKELLEWEHKMVQSYILRQHKSDSNDKDVIDRLTLKVEKLQQQLNNSQYENSQNIVEKFNKLCSIIDQLTSKEEELQHNVDEKMKNIDTSLAWLKENLMKTKP